MTVREAISFALEKLKPAQIQCADKPLHARQIVAALLQWDLAALITKDDHVLTPEQSARLTQLVTRRAAGEPFQYIVGYEWFWESKFSVGPGVLIPRPETEHVVEAILELAPPHARIVELGGGSGNIGISVLLERPDLHWLAFEKSPQALVYLTRNVERLLPPDTRYKIEFGDFFEGVDRLAPIDFLVSNPPYIPTSEIADLSTEVRSEPKLALDGGSHGLDVLERLIQNGPKWLKSGGTLVLEIGSEQEEEVLGSCTRAGYIATLCRRDLAGLPRVVTAIWDGGVT